jgi:hypothetical protein
MSRFNSTENTMKCSSFSGAPILSFRSILQCEERADCVGDDDPTLVAVAKGTAFRPSDPIDLRPAVGDGWATVCAPVVSERLAYWDDRVNAHAVPSEGRNLESKRGAPR